MNGANVYSSDAADNLEKQLKLSLRPVQPDREFVDHLHNRLTAPITTTIERRQSMGLSLLLVVGSLLSGIFMIWLLRQFRSSAA